MTTTHFASRALAVIACALTLAACATTKVAPPKPSLQEMLSQASQAAASGNKEQAIKVWQQTASTYPEDKTPWANIAQARYEVGQYGDAIMSAEEVLLRDPNDQLANSIIAISGLRLSTRAIGELSRQNNLSGSLRTESQDLAKLLRESLGETVLVPPPATKVAGKSDNVRKPPVNKKPKTNDSADPFADLK